MPISFAPVDPSISCTSWIFLCSRNLSLLLRILDLSYFCAFWSSLIFAHFEPLLFLRILDLSYFCAYWISLIFAHFGPFLFLRIWNSINYDCPCIHFIVAHYGPFCCCAFWIQLIMTARVYILCLPILFSVFREFFLQPSFINQGIILHFANIIHLSIDKGFFAFREYHPSFH